MPRPRSSSGAALRLRLWTRPLARRLQYRYIDLYHMHHVARDQRRGTNLDAMDTRSRQGTILYSAAATAQSGNFAAAQ